MKRIVYASFVVTVSVILMAGVAWAKKDKLKDRGFVTVAGSAFAASIEQGGEGWGPNFEGYGYMTPAEERTGTNRIAVITLNKDVQLPDSAIVTEFSCYWYDNDPTGEIDFFDANLWRRGLLDTSGSSMARLLISPVPPTENPDILSEVTDEINLPVIDNASFSYYINVVFSLGETTPDLASKIRWYGCQVKYKCK